MEITCLGDLFNDLNQTGQPSLGEAGSRLSGGQKQRIGIARAIASDSDIFVFDEVTSALDIKTEMQLIDNIRNGLTGKTVVMISHRPYPLSVCDRVYRLDNGKLVEVIEQDRDCK